MADWPTTDDLKQALDLDPGSDSWADRLAIVLSASIARVKRDVGIWDEMTDTPDEALNQAALRMGWLIWASPTQPVEVLSADPAYRALLFGHRRRFAVA
jgi:hypothetical protein